MILFLNIWAKEAVFSCIEYEYIRIDCFSIQLEGTNCRNILALLEGVRFIPHLI